MSDYLTFYVVPKRKSENEPKSHLVLASYPNDTYLSQLFNEILTPPNNDFLGVTPLTSDILNKVKKKFDSKLRECEERLKVYEKYATGNPDYINNILELRKFIEKLVFWRDKSSFILDMIQEMDLYDTGIEELCYKIS